MHKVTLGHRLKYRFDTIMGRGTPALLSALLVLSAAIVLSAALFVSLTGTAPGDDRFAELVWKSFLRTLDPGTMGGDQGPWAYRFAMLFVTLGGVFVISALIGIISNGIAARMDELRKGRSLVIENEHTLILGWSPQVFTIIGELVEANKNRRTGAAIVVLAAEDKVFMEDAIRARIPDTLNTSVVCRSGSPIDLADLEIGNPYTARSIILLPDGDDPDTHAIKAILAIAKNRNRREEPYHVVAQMADPRNAAIMRMVGASDTVLPVITSEVVAKIVAQTSRQCGLSIVLGELMDFGGDEVYFATRPVLTGVSYGEALGLFVDCAVFGLRHADGTVSLNPPMDTAIASDDAIIAIAEDDDRVMVSPTQVSLDEGAIRSGAPEAQRPEKTLILGWNRSAPAIVYELDAYVAPGSMLTIVSNCPNVEEQLSYVGGTPVNQALTLQAGDIRDRTLLETLGAAEYDHVIVLAYSHLGPQEADAITLVTLLHLRDIAERDDTPFSIVSEMLDSRNRDLAETAKVDDFIVSEHLVSLMMTQLSENADRAQVFEQLFDHSNAEITLKPAGDYVSCDREVNMYTVVEAARRRGETAIGYRIQAEAHEVSSAYGVHTNPLKSEMFRLCEGDKVIVVADA